MATSMVFNSCSVLMAFVFAYSASVQLNDHDWYFWFPLYACAGVVNMISWAISSKTIRQLAKAMLWLGMFLFTKVVMEDLAGGRTVGFWSLDLSERIVREKTGSGLVIFSMILHLEALSDPKQSVSRTRFLDAGMALLVFFCLGLPFVFFVIRSGEMRFDR